MQMTLMIILLLLRQKRGHTMTSLLSILVVISQMPRRKSALFKRTRLTAGQNGADADGVAATNFSAAFNQVERPTETIMLIEWIKQDKDVYVGSGEKGVAAISAKFIGQLGTRKFYGGKHSSNFFYNTAMVDGHVTYQTLPKLKENDNYFWKRVKH